MHVVNKGLTKRQPSRAGDVGFAEAEETAIRGLAFLSADKTRLGRFLALTGLEAGEVRRNAGSPWFLAAILDHLLADESLLLAFCAESGVEPERIAPARRALAPEDGGWSA